MLLDLMSHHNLNGKATMVRKLLYAEYKRVFPDSSINLRRDSKRWARGTREKPLSEKVSWDAIEHEPWPSWEDYK